jgi:hypothetical protein
MTLRALQLRHRGTIRFGLAVLVLAIAFPGRARADSYLPAFGGSGGGQFRLRCADSELLTGVELRAGDDIDAIRPLCVQASGPAETTPPSYTTGSGLDAASALPPGWTGGTGGGLQNVVCPRGQPIVLGMDLFAEGQPTVTVNTIKLFCGLAVNQQSGGALPAAVFEAPTIPYEARSIFDTEVTRRNGSLRCPAGQVAVGIHGRSGIWLDALGLICGEPRVIPKPEPAPGVKAVGRVKLAPGTPPSPPRPICEVAREARARNSPAAPGLEAQCRAQQAALAEAAARPFDLNALAARGEAIARQDRVAAELRNLQPDGPSRRGFNVGLAAAEGHTAPGPGKQKIHDQLSPAEQAGFDAAVSFSLTRNRKRIVDLAAKGEGIASQDPLAVELRNQQPEGPARHGFDVGMAAAEGQTAPGPGKQLIHDGLDPAEQGGFTTAVSFSLDRNRNAEAAAKGAEIAEADPAVAAARASETDVLYRLGFDIATGIFGDPALGAKGNTATGPGSNKIRNELSPSARRGFDASVAFHLSREYAR